MNKSNAWGKEPVKAVELSPEDHQKLCSQVIKLGEKRKAMHSNFNEVDFLAGAMAVMERLNIPCPVWPALFILGQDVIG